MKGLLYIASAKSSYRMFSSTSISFSPSKSFPVLRCFAISLSISCLIWLNSVTSSTYEGGGHSFKVESIGLNLSDWWDRYAISLCWESVPENTHTHTHKTCIVLIITHFKEYYSGILQLIFLSYSITLLQCSHQYTSRRQKTVANWLSPNKTTSTNSQKAERLLVSCNCP